MVGPDNELGAHGMAALAPALSKLVSLTSLNLEGTLAGAVVVCCTWIRRWPACADHTYLLLLGLVLQGTSLAPRVFLWHRR